MNTSRGILCDDKPDVSCLDNFKCIAAYNHNVLVNRFFNGDKMFVPLNESLYIIHVCLGVFSCSSQVINTKKIHQLQCWILFIILNCKLLKQVNVVDVSMINYLAIL